MPQEETMRLGGWARLGIVISGLWGALVAFVAYIDLPSLESLHSRWFHEASEVIAEAISRQGGQEVRPYQIKDALLKGSNVG
jgi:hypothetical protein